MPQISIIIPVYNADRYLSRCLNSVLAQSFTDWECICVDDGSTDASGRILDAYAERDARFKVIHKENGGVSSARQTALDRAHGEYVIHIDSDDWVEPEFLEAPLQIAISEKSDMVIFDYFEERTEGQKYSCQNPGKPDHLSVLNGMLSGSLYGSLWNKLVRRRLFSDYDIRFPEGMCLWEDLLINTLLTVHDIEISYLPRPLYHYDMYSNSGSLVRSDSRGHRESQKLFMRTADLLCGDDESRFFLRRRKFDILFYFYCNKTIDHEYFYTFFPEITDNKVSLTEVWRNHHDLLYFGYLRGFRFCKKLHRRLHLLKVSLLG